MENQKLLMMAIVTVALLGGLVLAHGEDKAESNDDSGMQHTMHGHMDSHENMNCGMDEPIDENEDGKCDHCGMDIESCPMHN